MSKHLYTGICTTFFMFFGCGHPVRTETITSSKKLCSSIYVGGKVTQDGHEIGTIAHEPAPFVTTDDACRFSLKTPTMTIPLATRPPATYEQQIYKRDSDGLCYMRTTIFFTAEGAVTGTVSISNPGFPPLDGNC